mmetsp:Transcript_39951/g.81812  ORF Transcript_39951/g.81812 Transcript_39951/m.81812 type:complete len:136 (+) Transcript_39951:1083-1490(+)
MPMQCLPLFCVSFLRRSAFYPMSERHVICDYSVCHTAFHNVDCGRIHHLFLRLNFKLFTSRNKFGDSTSHSKCGKEHAKKQVKTTSYGIFRLNTQGKACVSGKESRRQRGSTGPDPFDFLPNLYPSQTATVQQFP